MPLPDDDQHGTRTDGGDEQESPEGDGGQKEDRESRLPIELPAEVLKSLPEEIREVVLKAASFSGPLPPSPMFREYEDVLPGAGDRILSMAERQAAHRQEWEKSALLSAQKDLARGQWLGFLISLAALIAATYLAMNGHVIIPLLLGGGGVSGLVANFIKVLRRSQSSSDD